MNLLKESFPEYLDELEAVRPGANQASFNNIIYTFWYLYIKKINFGLKHEDISFIVKYLTVTCDMFGLYLPKNSHDNITYKILIILLLLDEYPTMQRAFLKDMSFLHACREVGFYRIWDIAFYSQYIGKIPKIVRVLMKPLLVFQYAQAMHAAITEKVRPKLIDSDPKLSRWKWWFLPRKKLYTQIGHIVTKTWKTPFGEKTTRHMQNDGKHLNYFKLLALGNKKMFKMYNDLLGSISRVNMYKIISKYFVDREHPLVIICNVQLDNIFGENRE